MPAKNDSLWNWLGRQIGHVKNAVKADVTKSPPPKAIPAAAPSATTAPPPHGAPKPQPQAQPQPPDIIYRDEKAEEVELPDRPGVKLRRTVIDEVIVERKDQAQKDDR